MRAVLVVNPRATATTLRTRDVLAAALSSDLRVDSHETKGRGHAIELATQAVETGADLVVALGGDGTVNEVVNGILSEGVRPGLPDLAVVPGGSTNVFARALGMPASAVEATGQILEALREGRSRRIGLGKANDRWFTFCAGLGIDAAAVARVEDKRAKGKRSTHSLYVRSAVNRFYLGSSRRTPPMRLRAPSLLDSRDVYLALVCNTDPWTFFGDRPVRPCPDASFDLGLDIFALSRMSTASTLRSAGRFFAKDPHPHSKNALLLHDQAELVLEATEGPLPFQVDGDALGDREKLVLTSVPAALRVIS
ncbi:MAG TPA: diacylglycerol kinase family protein [Frankiaceae bacterium]|jgi:diacylglycerol kinase family enzyme|nr:diacylglycerol kinase family protein [Frankiaceae bacterium]